MITLSFPKMSVPQSVIRCKLPLMIVLAHYFLIHLQCNLHSAHAVPSSYILYVFCHFFSSTLHCLCCQTVMRSRPSDHTVSGILMFHIITMILHSSFYKTACTANFVSNCTLSRGNDCTSYEPLTESLLVWSDLDKTGFGWADHDLETSFSHFICYMGT